jgi:multicomponent Na+:H+ antiporter subunit E
LWLVIPAQEPPPLPASLPAALLRASLFLGLWLVLAGPAGLPFGLLAAGLATWASLRLLPPHPGRLDPRALARLIGLTVRQTALAGWDVARRAFTRPPDVRPGVLDLPLPLPPGPRRDAFRALASLAPGSLPLADPPGGALRLHALDTALPLARDTGAAASAFARLNTAAPHG